MSVSFGTALNAYNNAAKVISDAAAGKPDDSRIGDKAGVSFSGIFNSHINNAATSLRAAEGTVSKALVKQADITDVVTAITSAEVTLKAVMQIRDKLVTAHQEIMRMPI